MKTDNPALIELDLDQVAAQDEAEFVVRHPKTGQPTTWVWTFFGPAHPKTIEVANRAMRQLLDENAAKEQARVNGKKWKEEAKDLEKLRADNIANIVARTKTFTPVKLGGERIDFSPEAATKILRDRKNDWLLGDIGEFLRETENFIQPSASD